MTKLDKTFYGEYIATPQKKYATRLTATLKTGIACTMLTMIVGTANAGLLNTTDVKFINLASDSVFGPYGGDIIPDQDKETIKNYVNGISTKQGKDTYAGNLLAGGNWTFLVRDKADDEADKADTPNFVSAAYGGLTFTLSAANGQNGQPNPSTWGLTVTDNDLNVLPSIPFTMDFLIHLHGGHNNAFYFFNDRTINTANAGTFQIAFTNPSGQNFPGLSNFDILVRDLRSIENGGGGGSEIPEPASLLLFGAGLLGFGLNRRRKQA